MISTPNRSTIRDQGAERIEWIAWAAGLFEAGED